MQAPYQHIGTVYQLADQHKAECLSEDYMETGQMVLRLRLEQGAVESLNSALLDATAGTVSAQSSEAN